MRGHWRVPSIDRGRRLEICEGANIAATEEVVKGAHGTVNFQCVNVGPNKREQDLGGKAGMEAGVEERCVCRAVIASQEFEGVRTEPIEGVKIGAGCQVSGRIRGDIV